MNIQAFKDYVRANSRRPEALTPEHVQSLIVKLMRRLGNPKYADKHAHYEAELARLSAVREVLTDG